MRIYLYKQPSNARSPMLVTLSGIITEVRFAQLQNARSPILVTLSGIITDVNLEQP